MLMMLFTVDTELVVKMDRRDVERQYVWEMRREGEETRSKLTAVFLRCRVSRPLLS